MHDSLYQIMGKHAATALPERKPAWLKVRAPGGPNYLAHAAAHAGPPAAFRLRRGALPEHWRMLGAWHRHLHDPRRRLHPELRLLRDRPRTSARATTSRSPRASPRRSPSSGCSTPSSRRSIATISPTSARTSSPRRFGRSTRSFPTARSRCSSPTSRGARSRSARCSRPRPRSTITTPRRCRASSSAAAPAAATSACSRSSASPSESRPNIPTKTGLILGMGETIPEVLQTMRELREVDVDILTLGQYLRPSAKHHPLDRYYTPEEFRAAPRCRTRDGLPARRVGTARALQLSRVGAGPGGGRLMARTRTSRSRFRLRLPETSMAKKKPEGSDDPALRLSLLREMLLMRRFEERTAEAYALGKIGGFCHLYIGQEAVGAGAISVLRPDDYVITSYRDHGQALARGITPRAVMAELFGRIDGLLEGERRLDAPLRSQHQLPRRPRHRRGTHSDRDGCRLRDQVSRRRSGVPLLLRRGGGEQRRVPRGAQHGGALAAAGDLSRREQPLRDGDGARARVVGERHRRARVFVRHAERGRRRTGCDRGARGRHRARLRARAARTRRRSSRYAPTASWATRCPMR